MPIRFLRIDSTTLSGRGVRPSATAALPARTGSQTIRLSVTRSTTRTIALLTSGPMPSPGNERNGVLHRPVIVPEISEFAQSFCNRCCDFSP